MTNINSILTIFTLVIWVIAGALHYAEYKIKGEKPSATDYCFAWGIATIFMIERVLELWGR